MPPPPSAWFAFAPLAGGAAGRPLGGATLATQVEGSGPARCCWPGSTPRSTRPRAGASQKSPAVRSGPARGEGSDARPSETPAPPVHVRAPRLLNEDPGKPSRCPPAGSDSEARSPRPSSSSPSSSSEFVVVVPPPSSSSANLLVDAVGERGEVCLFIARSSSPASALYSSCRSRT